MLTFRFKLHHVICCLLFLTIDTRGSDSSFSVYRCSSVDSRPSSKIFQTNLKLLLFSLTSKAPSTSGFHSNSTGETPDRAYGLALCRGDVASDVCLNCLTNITSDVAQHCMESTQGLVWHDYCLVRYNNHEFFGEIEADRFFQNHSQTRQYYQDVNARTLIQGLVESALSQPSMFAANELEVKKDNMAGSETRYGLVQCSRDLNTDNCGACLNELMKDYKSHYEGLRRWRIIAGSCSIWYDDRPFFFKLTYHEPQRMLKDKKNQPITYRAINPNKPVINNTSPGNPYTRAFKPDNLSSPAPSPTITKPSPPAIATPPSPAAVNPLEPPSTKASPPAIATPRSPPSPAAVNPIEPPSTKASPPATATTPSSLTTITPVVVTTELPPTRPSPGPGKRKKLLFLVSIGVLVLGILVATTILIFFLYRRRINKRAYNTKDVEMFLKNNGSLALKRY